MPTKMIGLLLAAAALALLAWIGLELHKRNELLEDAARRAKLEEPAPGGQGGLLELNAEQLLRDAQRPPPPAASR